MKKVIIILIIIVLSVLILIFVSIDDLNRENICLILNFTERRVEKNLFCDGGNVQMKGFADKRFQGEKGSKFRWMNVEKGSVNYFFGLYTLTGKVESVQEKQDEIKLQDSNIHDIEKPSFPEINADIVAVILKIEGNSDVLEEEIEEIFLHFQTDFRQPDIFYVYGAKIPERIRLLNNAEIIYIYNKPEILITDLAIIRSGKKDLHLKNNGTKRVRVK